MQSATKNSVELSSVNSIKMDDAQQISNIDEEIAEIEELINLQRRKVELLRKKNEFLKKSDSSNAEKSESISNPLQKANPKDSVKFATEDTTQARKIEDEKPIPTDSGKFGASSSSAKQLSLISSMQRMSRLSTDLANERNLLAWGRTALAAARTALAFLGLTGNNDFGVGLVYTTSIGFGVIAVWMMLQGGMRYKQIKRILLLPEPPVHFDRLSNLPVHIVLIVLLVLMVIANSADSWSH